MLAFIFTLFPLLIFLPELIKSGGIIYKITHLQASFLSLTFIIVLLVLRLVQKKSMLSGFYQKFYLDIAASLVLLAAGSLTLLFFTFPNFIYSHTYIRIEVLGYMVAAALTVWFIEKDNKFFRDNIKRILVFFPFGYLLAIMFLFLLPNNLLFALSLEDNLIENLQFIILLLGGLAGIVLGLKFLAKDIRYAAFFLLFAIGLLGIAGEEISWGQRIFHFGNSALQSINVQHETNVHNIRGVHSTIPIAYAVIGFLGSFGALLINTLNLFSKTFRTYLVPRNYLFFFFFFPLVYNVFALQYGDLTEASELSLHMGVTLFILQTSLLKERKKK